MFVVHTLNPGIQDICPVWLSELGCSLDSELTWFGKVCQYLASWQGEVGEPRDESNLFFLGGYEGEYTCHKSVDGTLILVLIR